MLTEDRASVVVVSELFENKTRIEQHRMVHEAVADELRDHIHGLSFSLSFRFDHRLILIVAFSVSSLQRPDPEALAVGGPRKERRRPTIAQLSRRNEGRAKQVIKKTTSFSFFSLPLRHPLDR